MSKYNWILDAGHGGIIDGKYVTSGKRSPIWEDGTQYFEGIGNRNIVKKMIKKLQQKYVKCVDLLGGSQEDVTLTQRAHKVNKLFQQNKKSILISIHSNGFKKESANGFSIYTSKGKTKSDQIATCFYNNMVTYFPRHKARKDTTDGDPDKEANFYILQKTNCPAILIENFFMTNYRECKLLMDEAFVNRLVECHVSSIMEMENSEQIIF